MSKVLRAAAVAAALVGLAVLGVGPASAADPTPTPSAMPTGYACLEQSAGYAPSGVCQLIVLKAQAVCRGNVPWLDYALEPQGTPNTTTTLVWGDPNGVHDTMAGLPLSGSVMWPGVVVDAQGNAVDWPGWTLVNGVWVQHDQWDWVRPQVQVTFQVNPTATITAVYPKETAPCADPPHTQVLAAPDQPSTAVLAATGTSNAEPLLLTAAGVLLLGSVLLAMRAAMRRRTATR
jgi:hypothetical protein